VKSSSTFEYQILQLVFFFLPLPILSAVGAQRRASSGQFFFPPGFQKQADSLSASLSNEYIDRPNSPPAMLPRDPKFPRPRRDSKLGFVIGVKRMIKGKGENQWKDSLRGGGPESPLAVSSASGRRSRSVRKPPVPTQRSISADSKHLPRANSSDNIQTYDILMPSRDPSSAAFRGRRRFTSGNIESASLPPDDTSNLSLTSHEANAAALIEDLRDKIEYFEAVVADKNLRLEKLQHDIAKMEEQNEIKWNADLAREANLKRDFAQKLEDAHNKLRDSQEQNQMLQARMESLQKEIEEKDNRAQERYQKRERQLLLRVRELERKLQQVNEVVRTATAPPAPLEDPSEPQTPVGDESAPPASNVAPPLRPVAASLARTSTSISKEELRTRALLEQRNLRNKQRSFDEKRLSSGSYAVAAAISNVSKDTADNTRAILAEKRNLRQQKKAEHERRTSLHSPTPGDSVSPSGAAAISNSVNSTSDADDVHEDEHHNDTPPPLPPPEDALSEHSTVPGSSERGGAS